MRCQALFSTQRESTKTQNYSILVAINTSRLCQKLLNLIGVRAIRVCAVSFSYPTSHIEAYMMLIYGDFFNMQMDEKVFKKVRQV